MSVHDEQQAAELAKLREVLEERGVLGVLQHCIDNPTETLGAANTALIRGALLFTYRLIRDHGKVNTTLHTLLGGLTDGAVFARVILAGEKCTIDPAPRLRIGSNLDESIWRLQTATEAAVSGARRE